MQNLCKPKKNNQIWDFWAEIWGKKEICQLGTQPEVTDRGKVTIS